jgi:tetratricopeptide (TPR) repeat protein
MNLFRTFLIVITFFPTLLLGNVEELFDTYDYACGLEDEGKTEFAIKIFESIVDNKYATRGLVVESYNNIGRIHLRKLNYIEASKAFNKVLDYPAIDSISIAMVKYNLAIVSANQAKYTQAIIQYHDCYNFRNRIDHKDQYTCLYDLASIYLDIYEYFSTDEYTQEKAYCLDSADKYIRLSLAECQDALDKNKDAPELVSKLNMDYDHLNTLLGEIHVKKGEYVVAISYFHTAKDNAIGGHNIDIIEYYFLQLAECHLANYESAGSLVMVEKYLTLANANIDSSELRYKAHYYYNWSKYLYYKSDFLTASIYADSSSTLFKLVGDKIYLSNSFKQKAECLRELGDVDSYTENIKRAHQLKEAVWANNFINGTLSYVITEPLLDNLDTDAFYDSFNYLIFPILLGLLLLVISIQYKTIQMKASLNKQLEYDNIKYYKGIAKTADTMRKSSFKEPTIERMKNDFSKIQSFISETPYSKEENDADDIIGEPIAHSIRNIFRRK